MPMQHGLRDYLILAFCRLGVAGLSPVIPGTCGTLLAIFIAPVIYFPLSFPLRILFLAILFWLGALAATKAEKLLKQHDPGEVVIDELVGVWLTLLPFNNPDWKQAVAAFLLFRIFDMLKPWPVRLSESWLPAGYGIMIDDVIAGIMAMGCMGCGVWLEWL